MGFGESGVKFGGEWEISRRGAGDNRAQGGPGWVTFRMTRWGGNFWCQGTCKFGGQGCGVADCGTFLRKSVTLSQDTWELGTLVRVRLRVR